MGTHRGAPRRGDVMAMFFAVVCAFFALCNLFYGNWQGALIFALLAGGLVWRATNYPSPTGGSHTPRHAKRDDTYEGDGNDWPR